MDRPSRLRVLDGARGVALILMLISHSMQLFPGGDNPDWAWSIINGLLLLTKVSTPLFIWVFGMTMAYVYYPQLDRPETFSLLKRRLWKRALLVFLSYQVLIIVIETAQGSTLDHILRRMVYLEPGHWVEVLNFYLIVMVVSPWLLRAWRSARTVVRFSIMPILYFAGVLISQIPVSPAFVMVKNVFVSYPVSSYSGVPPDTFPVFQLSAFYLLGLTFGEHLYKKIGQHDLAGLQRATLLAAAGCLTMSFMWVGQSPQIYLRSIAKDFYKFPPQPPYIFFGLFGILMVMVVCLWYFEMKRKSNLLTRTMEGLGRNSLFTFNVQYVFLFTVCGYLLQLFLNQHLFTTLAYTLLLIFSCAVAASLYEKKVKRSTR